MHLQVSEYVFDRVRPTLDGFEVDFDLETLTLTFSETVRSSTLNVSQITLHETNEGGLGQEYTLITGTLNTTDDPVVVFTLAKQVLMS